MEQPQNTPAPDRPNLTVRQLVALLTLGLVVLGLSVAAARWLRSRLSQAAQSPNSALPKEGPAQADLIHKGKLVYRVYCVNCHGPEGRGDGPSSAELKPPPRDLAQGPWKFGTSPAAIRKVIVEGIPGTSMPAAGQALSSADLDALVAYVATLASRGRQPPESQQKQPRLSERTLIRLRQAGFVPVGVPGPAPDLTLSGSEEQRVTLSRLKGKVILLHFWGTSCPACLAELPALERLAETFHGQGLEVLCVCSNVQDLSRAAVARQHVKRLTVYTDPAGSASIRYDAQVVPTSFLIDEEGYLVGKVQGGRTWTTGEFRGLLEMRKKG